MDPPPPTYTLTATSISYSKSPSTFLFKPCSSTNILTNVSLSALPSQILAIVGPSGAGKSTLLDILSARTSPTSGSLLLNSLPLIPSSFRKLSAYVPQHDACLPLLTVAETFAFSAALLNPDSPSDVPSIVTALLRDLRLSHLSHVRLAHGLSGGERRRVSIGLSLLHDPAVLLLDEPTSGLDSASALSVMQTLRSAFAFFVLVIWTIVLMANSFVLFLSSVAPNYIVGTSLLTLLLAGFFLFSGYFISSDRLPKFWAFMHFLSMYKYALDALLINEYSCLVSTCLIWYDEGSKTCMINGGDFLEKRGLDEGQRWRNVYVMIGFFVAYRILCLMVLIRRVSRSKK
ncbi:hypothetical protein SASPL_126788 [Salvia splendens]|uniref:ABC transporter domain-containing protein n=1 Tax=Salvia splendens TaxID=180675 RepID=A0A8X8ZRH2_SALSN|nr:hypothetical protein SASPL_126788 [Salvia splendens]